MCQQEMEMKAREHDMSDVTPEAVTEAAVIGYNAIEKAVVDGYKKIETGAVEGFGKVVDKCVEVLFAKPGESVEDAKKRLKGEEEA